MIEIDLGLIYSIFSDESQAAAATQSSYMTNMVLPEIVQSSKNFPLGPDCLITRDESPEQSIL